MCVLPLCLYLKRVLCLASSCFRTYKHPNIRQVLIPHQCLLHTCGCRRDANCLLDQTVEAKLLRRPLPRALRGCYILAGVLAQSASWPFNIILNAAHTYRAEASFSYSSSCDGGLQVERDAVIEACAAAVVPKICFWRPSLHRVN